MLSSSETAAAARETEMLLAAECQKENLQMLLTSADDIGLKAHRK
jgi:hypothetical protein